MMKKKKEFAFITFYLMFLHHYSLGGQFEIISNVLNDCLKSEKINFINFVFGQITTDSELELVTDMIQKNYTLLFGK
jgi:hypothetical protein